MSERVCTCNSSTKDWGIHDWDCALEFVRKFPPPVEEDNSNRNTAISIAHYLSSFAWLDGLTDEDYRTIQNAVMLFVSNPRQKVIDT